MSTGRSNQALWYPSPCPNCGRTYVAPMSLVDGVHHYRCPDPCLWSWKRPHPAIDTATCHRDIAPGNECATCGAYHPAVKWKGE